LQIAENASPEVIKGAYKYLSQKWHPDKNPSERGKAEQISKILNEAYSVLSDPVLRAEHDIWIREQRKLESSAKPVEVLEAGSIGAGPPNNQGFFKRAWLMLLFGAGLILAAVVVPYLIITEGFDWRYLWAVFCGFAMGQHAYIQLFHPDIAAEESRKQEERERKFAEASKKAHTAGLVSFLAAFPIACIALVSNGVWFELAVLFGVILAAVAGMLGWVVIGILASQKAR